MKTGSRIASAYGYRPVDMRSATQKSCHRHAATNGACVKNGCHNCPAKHPAAVTGWIRTALNVAAGFAVAGMMTWAAFTAESVQAAIDLSSRV